MFVSLGSFTGGFVTFLAHEHHASVPQERSNLDEMKQILSVLPAVMAVPKVISHQGHMERSC
jgi:hypothetical protein